MKFQIRKDLEKLFNKENRKIVFNFGHVFGLRILQMLLALATSYVLVRALSKQQYGEYHYVLGWIGILSIFALPGLADSTMQAIARGFPGMYRIGAKWSFFCSLGGSLILGFMAIWYHLFGDNKAIAAGFMISCLFFPFAHGMIIWKSTRHGIGDFKSLFQLEGINSIVMSTLIILGVLLEPGNIIIPIAVILCIPGLQNLVQSIKALKTIDPNLKGEEGNLAFGLKTTIYATLSLLAAHIDKILLFHFLSPEALAVFIAAQKLTEPVNSITQDLGAVLAPRFTKYTYLTDNLDRAFIYLSIAMGIGILVVAFTILPPILILIFGEPYFDAIIYCQGLMCSLILGNIANLRFRFIRSRMSLDSVRKVTLGNSVFRILASISLIPLFGINGAVASVALTRLALAVQVDLNIRQFKSK